MTMVSPSASAARCSILSACRVVRARKRRPLLRVGQRRVDVVGIDLGRRHVVRVAAIALAAEVLHELGMERQRGVTDRRVDDHSLADAARIAPGPRRRCGPRPAAPWMRGKVTVERFREDAAPSFVPWMPNSSDAGLDDPVVPSRPRSDVRVVHAAGAHPTLRRSGGVGWSSRKTSLSMPPWPVSTVARMVAGTGAATDVEGAFASVLAFVEITGVRFCARTIG